MMNPNERFVRAIERERMVRRNEPIEEKITLKRVIVSLESKKEAVGAVRLIAEVKKNAPIEKMKTSNRTIAEMQTKVSPRRYFIMRLFGLVTAIFGVFTFFVIKDSIGVLIIISGAGIFVMESIYFEEAEDIEKRLIAIDAVKHSKIELENGKREKWKDNIRRVQRTVKAYSLLLTKSIVRRFRVINCVNVFVRRGQ